MPIPTRLSQRSPDRVVPVMTANPARAVWDDGFHGWGIWLFGIWIPIVGIGTF